MLMRLHVSVHLAWATSTLLGLPQEAKARYDAEAELRSAREAAVEAARAAAGQGRISHATPAGGRPGHPGAGLVLRATDSGVCTLMCACKELNKDEHAVV